MSSGVRLVEAVVAVAVITVLAGTPVVAEEQNSSANGDSGDEEPQVVDHQLGEGETLGTVAIDHEVNVVDLMEWNDVDDVRDVSAGDDVEVPVDEERDEPSGPQPVVHVVDRGETFGGVAEEYGVRASQLQQWNPGVNPDQMQIGEQLQLHVPGSDGDPVSWGRANDGRLYNGVAMHSSPGLFVRNVSRAYGTDQTVDLLQAAGADVRARWPDAPKLVVGSISLRNGGPMRPHRSHQSGRDADLSYYHRGNVALDDFRDMSPEIFDAVKNWHFFKTLIETGEVEFIFVDYDLQEVLYDYARSIGYEDEDLEEILQYPRGRGVPIGIIRHSSGHQNHFHIRFRCTDTDQNCR